MSLKNFARTLFLKAQAIKLLLDEGKLEEAKKELEKILELLS